MDVEKVREQLLTGSVLTMNRVPKDVAKAFKDLAKEHFCDDYGMTFKWIWDRWTLLEELIQSAIYSKIVSDHEKRIAQLEGAKKSTIKMLDGKEVKRDDD